VPGLIFESLATTAFIGGSQQHDLPPSLPVLDVAPQRFVVPKRQYLSLDACQCTIVLDGRAFFLSSFDARNFHVRFQAYMWL